MKLTIVCAGKIKEAWLADAIREYKKRLQKYCALDIIEVQDSPDTLPRDVALDKEGKAMLSKIKASAYVFVSDLHGKECSSEEWSEKLIRGFEKGGSEVVIVIGGSWGLSPELIARADERICLSQMTFTHQMTRLILLEQSYRGFKIHNNEKYHK